MLNAIVELYIIPIDSNGDIMHQDLWIHVNNPEYCLKTLRCFRKINNTKVARIILIDGNGNQRNHFQNSDGTITPLIRELCN